MDSFVCARSKMTNITRLSSLPGDLTHHKGRIPSELAHHKNLYSSRVSKTPTRRRVNSSAREARKSERKHSVHTQTPLTDLAYEFDAAFYNFKETVRRTVPTTRPHHRVYLPTIIDTKPRSRRSRSTAFPSPSQAAPPLPLCTCKHRALPSTPRPRPLLGSPTKRQLELEKQMSAPEPQYHAPPPQQKVKYRLSPHDQPLQYHVTPRDQYHVTSRDSYMSMTSRDSYLMTPVLDHVTPVLAVAIRRNAQDKDPIVEFNGVVGLHANRIAFTPFVRHVSTQTVKSNVHVQFEIPDEN